MVNCLAIMSVMMTACGERPDTMQMVTVHHNCHKTQRHARGEYCPKKPAFSTLELFAAHTVEFLVDEFTAQTRQTSDFFRKIIYPWRYCLNHDQLICDSVCHITVRVTSVMTTNKHNTEIITPDTHPACQDLHPPNHKTNMTLSRCVKCC